MDNTFIKINKLDEFNPRTDTKKHYWFRVDNDIHASRALLRLSAEQKWFFICLVGLAIKYRNDDELVPFDVTYLSDISKVSEEKIFSALAILHSNKTLSVVDEAHKPAQNFSEFLKNGAYNTIQNNTYNTGHTLQNHSSEVLAPSPVALKKPKTKANPLNKETFKAYAEAYKARYHVEVKPNAKINTQISNLVKLVGDEAPALVRFFVSHNDSWYVRHMHSFGHCLSNAESLRTQWLKGRAITSTDIRRYEKNQEQDNLLAAIERGEV